MNRKLLGILVVSAILLLLLGLTTAASADSLHEGWLWPTTPSYRQLSRGYSSSHSGIDISVGSGSPVYASKSGTILMTYTGCNNFSKQYNCSERCSPNCSVYSGNGTCNWGYGNGVIIQHADGSISMYAHMSSVSVSNGQGVTQGQLIGYTGSTGNSTGPHLHFELASSYTKSGTYYNPNSYDNNPNSPDYGITSSNKTNLSTSNGYQYNPNGVQYIFSTNSEPLTASLKADRESINVGETVYFTFTSNKNADFWLHVVKDGNDTCTQLTNNMPTSGSTSWTFNEAGTYYVRVGASNYGVDPDVGSNEITINVHDNSVDLGEVFYAFIRNQSQNVYCTNQLNNIAGEAYTGDLKQLWKFVRQSNGSYAILSALNNACMDVLGLSTDGGTNVYAYNGNQTIYNANQQFYIYYQYDAYYFSPVHTYGQCMLDMNANSHNLEIWGPGQDWAPQEFDIIKVPTFNNTLPVNLGDNFYAFIRHQAQNVYLTNQQNNIAGEVYTCGANQIWKFIRQNNGSYAIVSALDNACMDVFGVATGDATNVYAYNGNQQYYNSNQQFYIYNTYGAYYFSPVHTFGQKMLDMNANSLNLEIWGPGADWSPQEFDIVTANYPIPNKPTLSVSASDSLHASVFSWSATQNTDFYSIRIYDTSGNRIYLRDEYDKTAFAALLPAGNYQAEVCGVRRDVWVTESDRVPFTVTAASPTHTPEIERLDALNGKLYKLYSFEGTWMEAKALAEAEGGRLAIVDSQAKQDCIYQMVNDFGQIAYLGAQGYTNYYWKWVDGSKVEGFTNWEGSNPDNWQGLENCMTMYYTTGTWNDFPNDNSSRMGYVAEFDAVSLSVETIEPFWLEGVDSIRDNLQVVVTFADGSPILMLGGYDLSTVEGDGYVTVNVGYAGFTASCEIATRLPDPDFILPAGLTAIGEEAFMGIDAEVVEVPAGCVSIGARAFADCPNLKYVIVSDLSAIDIAEDALDGTDAVFIEQ